MRRTCERPGCAEPASVAFGMVPEDLLVWLEACDPATLGERRPGLLCRRHADKMVVPNGWTLDDHRVAVPQLFKVAEAPIARRPTGDHSGRLRRPRLQQASLLDLVAQEMLDDVTDPTAETPAPATASEPAAPVAAEVVAPATASEPVVAAEPAATVAAEPVESVATIEPQLFDAEPAESTPSEPELIAAAAPQPAEPAESVSGEPVWAPLFDRSDDLDGLLAPRGRLLRRAFGTDPRE